MPAPELRSRIERRMQAGKLQTDTPLQQVTGISKRVSEQYGRDHVGPDGRLTEKYPSLARELRKIRDEDIVRFEKTRRVASRVADFAEQTDDLFFFSGRNEGVFPVTTVGEFVASTASTRPIATSHTRTAITEIRQANLNLEQLGIPSDHWQQLAFLGKRTHSNAYELDLSENRPPAVVQALGSSYWDPSRSAEPLDNSAFVTAGDISEPVTIDDTEYVVLTAEENVYELLDEGKRTSATYHPVQAAPLAIHAQLVGTNYADPTVLRENVRIATEEIRNPNTSDTESVAAILAPSKDGYATHHRSNRQDEPIYGIRESLLFERLAKKH